MLRISKKWVLEKSEDLLHNSFTDVIRTYICLTRMMKQFTEIRDYYIVLDFPIYLDQDKYIYYLLYYR